MTAALWRLAAAELLLRAAAAHLHHSRARTTPWPSWSSSSWRALVSSVVDLAARRTRQAARATAEAETLGTLAGSVLRGETALPALLERVREAFGLTSVTLLETEAATDRATSAATGGATGGRVVVASAGVQPCQRPQDADTEVPAGDIAHARAARAAAARRGPARHRRLRRPGRGDPRAARLSEAAAAAAPIAEADRMRTALLAAVGHDLRTPLASAKAAVTSLRSDDIALDAAGPATSCSLTADESLDRLPGWSTTCST